MDLPFLPSSLFFHKAFRRTVSYYSSYHINPYYPFAEKPQMPVQRGPNLPFFVLSHTLSFHSLHTLFKLNATHTLCHNHILPIYPWTLCLHLPFLYNIFWKKYFLSQSCIALCLDFLWHIPHSAVQYGNVCTWLIFWLTSVHSSLCSYLLKINELSSFFSLWTWLVLHVSMVPNHLKEFRRRDWW